MYDFTVSIGNNFFTATWSFTEKRRNPWVFYADVYMSIKGEDEEPRKTGGEYVIEYLEGEVYSSAFGSGQRNLRDTIRAAVIAYIAEQELLHPDAIKHI